MRRTLGVLVILCLSTSTVLGVCRLDIEKASPDFLQSSNCFFPLNLLPQTIIKTERWNGYISNDGPVEVAFLNWSVTGTGRCWGTRFCWPDFFGANVLYPPLTGTAVYVQRVRSYVVDSINGTCVTSDDTWHTIPQNCPTPGGICGGGFYAPIGNASAGDMSPTLPISLCCSDLERYTCEYGGGSWDEANCSCLSPIVIDVAGNGFNLTSAAGGVSFDITSDGVPDEISWTSSNSDDAWLAYDRNGNGIIDNGKELFGSSTPQPILSQGESKNGFRALAMLDRAEFGGNNDGQIDDADAVFSKLQLWQDRNHNGFSEAEELKSLSGSNIHAVELQYRESKRRDENGNWFRYRAKVKDARNAQVGRWAWDVFLQKPN